MSLIVEDGSSKIDAESFTTIAFADAYHTARGREATWSDLDDEVKEQHLRAATDYMQSVYQDRWLGFRMTYTQSLEWPRKYVPRTREGYAIIDSGQDYWWPETSIPTPIQNACAELAFKAISGALMRDLSRARIKEKIGPMDVEYDRKSPEQKRYEVIDRMLSRFLYADDGLFADTERA